MRGTKRSNLTSNESSRKCARLAIVPDGSNSRDRYDNSPLPDVALIAMSVGRRICYETVIGELQDHNHVLGFLTISRSVHLREVNEKWLRHVGE